jgi:small subunit ribosomal protein S1
MDYGLLVDVGAVLGLVHVTNISWGKTRDLTKSFKIGDEVSVKVLSFTPDKERISLGMKQLLPDPWPEIEKKYPVGAKVEAPVVALKKYGAFVELEEGI